MNLSSNSFFLNLSLGTKNLKTYFFAIYPHIQCSQTMGQQKRPLYGRRTQLTIKSSIVIRETP